jgi:uncharacterized protein YndB with AHSA1/START domain
MNDSVPSVVIERLIPAPPRVVFEAWLDREALQRFMCGGPGVRVTRAECDPRVGGKFLIVMNVEGHDLPHQGEYLEIERYTRIVFTWRSHLAGEGSRVTLSFAESGRGETRLTLEHVGLADAEIRSKHHGGWSHILTELFALTAARA